MADVEGDFVVFLIGALFLITGLGYGFGMSRLRHGPARADEVRVLAESGPATPAERPSTNSAAGPPDPARSN